MNKQEIFQIVEEIFNNTLIIQHKLIEDGVFDINYQTLIHTIATNCGRIEGKLEPF